MSVKVKMNLISLPTILTWAIFNFVPLLT